MNWSTFLCWIFLESISHVGVKKIPLPAAIVGAEWAANQQELKESNVLEALQECCIRFQISSPRIDSFPEEKANRIHAKLPLVSSTRKLVINILHKSKQVVANKLFQFESFNYTCYSREPMFLKGIKEQPIQINNIEKTNKQKKATGSKHPLVALISSPIETDTASGQRGIWALGKHHEALSSASQFPWMRTRLRFQKCIKRAKRVW